jgi:[methyl-Co(III) methanol-specific corrinoid protein]:coenzyme M methyltransferase
MRCVERFLEVLGQRPVDRPPVVGVTNSVTLELMREVGTRWPDAHHDPEQMVRAGAAAHVVCGLESVKVPFDMTVESGALGADIDYGTHNTLPRARAPLYATPEEFDSADDYLTRGRIPTVLAAIRLARQRYGDRVPVISSVVGPFTLCGFLFGQETLLVWMLSEPENLQAAMRTASRLVARYIHEQFRAGAQVVQVAEPVASGDLISPTQYARHVAPFHRELSRGAEGPLLVHICGNITGHLSHLVPLGFHGISFDAMTDIQAARGLLKGRKALIGYVPTSVLREGSPEEVRIASRQCLRAGVDALNAGCAWPPETPLANIRAMIAAGQDAVGGG